MTPSAKAPRFLRDSAFLWRLKKRRQKGSFFLEPGEGGLIDWNVDKKFLDLSHSKLLVDIALQRADYQLNKGHDGSSVDLWFADILNQPYRALAFVSDKFHKDYNTRTYIATGYIAVDPNLLKFSNLNKTCEDEPKVKAWTIKLDATREGMMINSNQVALAFGSPYGGFISLLDAMDPKIVCAEVDLEPIHKLENPLKRLEKLYEKDEPGEDYYDLPKNKRDKRTLTPSCGVLSMGELYVLLVDKFGNKLFWCHMPSIADIQFAEYAWDFKKKQVYITNPRIQQYKEISLERFLEISKPTGSHLNIILNSLHTFLIEKAFNPGIMKL